MNKILALAASIFVTQAAYVCAADVNVSNLHGIVFSSAYFGENVARTFARVNFNQHPQGYGWVAGRGSTFPYQTKG